MDSHQIPVLGHFNALDFGFPDDFSFACYREGFYRHIQRYAGFARKAALSNKELQIVCPQRANDLVDEGKALHHCVGGYIDNVAEGRCPSVY